MYVHERPEGSSFIFVTDTEITRSLQQVFQQEELREAVPSRETVRILTDEINQRRRDEPTVPFVDIFRSVFEVRAALIGEKKVDRDACKAAVLFIEHNRGHRKKPIKHAVPHHLLPLKERRAIEDDVWQDVYNTLAAEGRTVFTPRARRISR